VWILEETGLERGLTGIGGFLKYLWDIALVLQVPMFVSCRDDSIWHNPALVRGTPRAGWWWFLILFQLGPVLTVLLIGLQIKNLCSW
jgi:hypothetical protein